MRRLTVADRHRCIWSDRNRQTDIDRYRQIDKRIETDTDRCRNKSINSVVE